MQKLEEDEVGEIISSGFYWSLSVQIGLCSHIMHVILNHIAKPGVNLTAFIIFWL